MLAGLRGKVRQVKNDVSVFGLDALKIHWGKFRGLPRVDATLDGVGAIALRPADSDFETFRQVYTAQQYEILPQDQKQRHETFYATLVQSGMTPVIIDAGANIGAATLWFADKFPLAHIIAVEPNPGNAALCRVNAARRMNVTVVEGAIGGKSGFAAVTSEGLSWATTTKRSDNPTELAVYTIADLKRMAKGHTVLFVVKIDIEGFESDLFEGDISWVNHTAAVYIELHDWAFPGQKTSQAAQRALMGRGFEMLINGETLMFVRDAIELDQLAVAGNATMN
jgi:FkbM family methyltransferase